MSKNKPIYVCENYISAICDKINEALNKCAKETLQEEISGIVDITTQNYKELLLSIMFEKGEE